MFEQMEKTRLSQGNAHQWFFVFAKIPHSVIYDNKIRYVLRSLSKKFINGC